LRLNNHAGALSSLVPHYHRRLARRHASGVHVRVRCLGCLSHLSGRASGNLPVAPVALRPFFLALHRWWWLLSLPRPSCLTAPPCPLKFPHRYLSTAHANL